MKRISKSIHLGMLGVFSLAVAFFPKECLLVRAENAQAQTFSTSTYFRNLGKYAPHNVNGSCSYVALAMMLSYYDSFYNDNLFDGVYERHDAFEDVDDALLVSPGVQHSSGFDYTKDYGGLIEALEDLGHSEDSPSIIALLNEKRAENLAYVESVAYTDFQMKLVKTQWDLDGSSSDHEFAWSITKWQDVLNAFYGTGKVTATTVFLEDKDLLEEQAIERIEEGQILGLRVRKYNAAKTEEERQKGKPNAICYDYHAIVGYDTNDNGIVAHFGWDGVSDRSVDLSQTDWQVDGYVYLDFPGFAFEHSKNYYIDGVGYCGCGEHVIHEFKTYDTNFPLIVTRIGIGDLRPPILPPDNPKPYNSHRAICACGHWITEQHFIYEGTDYYGMPPCSGCGETVSAIRAIERPKEV